MPASSPVELTLFDFVDEFASQVRMGNPKARETVVGSSRIVVFCESFFDQFFAKVLHSAITGFDPDSKRKAARMAEQLKGEPPSSAELRALVALFESFCDMYLDVIKGSYGAAEITYARFHQNYMRRLLERAGRWAEQVPYPDLAARIAQARSVYTEAIGAMRW
jgi:hypothetical protein